MFKPRAFVKNETGYVSEMYRATIYGKQREIYFSGRLFFVEVVKQQNICSKSWKMEFTRLQKLFITLHIV